MAIDCEIHRILLMTHKKVYTINISIRTRFETTNIGYNLSFVCWMPTNEELCVLLTTFKIWISSLKIIKYKEEGIAGTSDKE